MRRLTLCLILMASSAAAQDKEELCRISSEIAGAAVMVRAEGMAQDKAIEQITADLDESAASFEAAVQPIVEWVYTLPEEQLTEDVQTAYEAACLEQ